CRADPWSACCFFWWGDAADHGSALQGRLYGVLAVRRATIAAAAESTSSQARSKAALSSVEGSGIWACSPRPHHVSKRPGSAVAPGGAGPLTVYSTSASAHSSTSNRR